MQKEVEKYLRLKRKLIVLEYARVKPIKHAEFQNLLSTIGLDILGQFQLLISVSLVIVRLKVDAKELPFAFSFAIVNVQIQGIAGL